MRVRKSDRGCGVSNRTTKRNKAGSENGSEKEASEVGEGERDEMIT